MLASIKRELRLKLIACAECYRRYRSFKYLLSRTWLLTYFVLDIRHTARHMRWMENDRLPINQLQAKLLFYYHKIEKGLSMPGKKRLFGLEVIPQVASLIEAWERKKASVNDPIYLGAISSLHAYAEHIEREGLDKGGQVNPWLHDFLSSRPLDGGAADTPLLPRLVVPDSPVSFDNFKKLTLQRRSYRNFSEQHVPEQLIQAAVELAQLSPSACNRQPCRVHVISAGESKRAALALQNGNAGFGHLAPIILAITSDAGCFFDATERHQPFIDGGIFTMALIYSLQVQGLVSCCLNWCVHPAQDQKLRALIPIKSSERVIMLMAVGFPPEHAVVPRSHRKSTQDVLVWH